MLKELNTRVETKGEYLRPCHIDDLESLLTITSDPSLMTFMGGAMTKKETLKILDRFSQNEVNSENWWIICQKVTMTVVGFLSTRYNSSEKSVSLNIVIKSEFQKQGIASHAINSWIQNSYKKLGIRLFMIYVPSDYVPAKKLIRSLGMKFKKYLFRKGKSYELYVKTF